MHETMKHAVFIVYYQLHTYIIDQDQKTNKGNFNFQLRTSESNHCVRFFVRKINTRTRNNSGNFKLVMAAELGLNSTAKLKSAS